MTNFDNIPAELRERDQWLYWNAGKDSPRAPLESPAAPYPASWSKPDSWLSFDEVAEGAADVEQAGIGFVNAADNADYARGLYGSLDLDGVVAEDGFGLKDWVPSIQPFIDRDAYIEFSPSDTGLRIPVVGIEVPEWWGDKVEDDHEGIEVLTNKFSTYTGNQIDGSGDTVVEYGDWVDDWLREAYIALYGEPPEDQTSLRSAGDSGEDHPDPGTDWDGDEWLDEDVAEDALDHIPADCDYQTWRDIGMALVNHFGSGTGGRLFKSWSQGGSKWDRDAKQQADRIISDASGYDYDAGTVVYYAQTHGFDPTDHARTAANAGGSRATTDGGATTDTTADDSGGDELTLGERIQAAARRAADDDITDKQARHEIAVAFGEHKHFVYPEGEQVMNWSSELYVWSPESGIYEDRGEGVVKRMLDRHAGPFATNTTAREVVSKLERRHMTNDQLSPHPGRLVVDNGILDLRDGTLDEHTPHEYHRTKLDVVWNPDAGDTPTEIDNFLRDVVDEDNVDTLYRLIASCLWKDTIEEKAGMLIGSGQNGKSVFLDMVKEFLGVPYNVSSKELRELTDYKFARKQLINKLANLATEVGAGTIRDTTYFKKLTSGDYDEVPDYHNDAIPAQNHATMLFATNGMPSFNEDNQAIWRRWVPVEFPYTFSADDEEAKDPVPKSTLERRLQRDEEFEALLVRCQQELERWHDGEPLFKDAMSPDEVREMMKAAAEPVYSFATSCLERGDPEEAAVSKEVMRRAYREFAEAENLDRVARNEFGERLLSLRDYRIESGRRNNNEHVYRGVRLSPLGRQMAGVDDPEDDDQEQMDDIDDSRKVVLDQLRDMADAADEPVPEQALNWAVRGDLSDGTAKHTIERLKEAGEIVDTGDGLLPT